MTVKKRKTPRSEYLQALFGVGDALLAAQNADDLQAAIGDVEALRDDTQEKFDNMPEGLQAGPTGEKMQERIDNLESVLSTLEDLHGELEEAGEDVEVELERVRDTVNELDGYEFVPAPDAPKTPATKALPAPVVRAAVDPDHVAILDAAFADPAMVELRAAKGVCATIRAIVAAHPTLPKSAFVAAGVKIGLNPATVGIQRLQALKNA